MLSGLFDEAWPYLKENKIPFILFVSTQPVGKRGYMNWDEIREIENLILAILDTIHTLTTT